MLRTPQGIRLNLHGALAGNQDDQYLALSLVRCRLALQS